MNQYPNVQPYTTDEKQFAMFIHFSLLAGYVSFGLGWILPLILWQIKKDSSPYINAHGKIVMNWIISKIIYGAVFLSLSLILIGIIPLISLGICSVIFAVIGGIKANNGETWHYPLSITFLS